MAWLKRGLQHTQPFIPGKSFTKLPQTLRSMSGTAQLLPIHLFWLHNRRPPHASHGLSAPSRITGSPGFGQPLGDGRHRVGGSHPPA